MRGVIRGSFGIVFALVILFTSVQFASARGQTSVAGVIVICTGAGLVHVLVDENGEPTGDVMICPDCAQAFFAHATADGPFAERVAVWSALWQSRTATHAADMSKPQSQPRGPPLSV